MTKTENAKNTPAIAAQPSAATNVSAKSPEPMTFLTTWRLTLAADLLREPGATVGSVARQVGYGSPFTLSSAFKRVRGISPQQHRAGRESVRAG